ncbi:MAG TPA: hypothetical protein DIW47_07470 [Bacteroidetes bacterium]|nr:hypothetical protein [Bacteroidota bacterium]
MKVKNLFKIGIALAVFAFYGGQVKAQVLGYGNASDGNGGGSSGIIYEDNNRAKVASFTSSSVTIDPTTSHGTFVVGDKVLLVQMKGGTIGAHEALTVSSVFLNTIGFTPGLVHFANYSVAGSARVQIIKINEYYDYGLSGAIVTCHAWDGNTGGIVCFMVQRNFTQSSGAITVAGKGFLPESITWGVGGYGGFRSTNYGTGGVAGPGTDAGAGGGGTPCNTKCFDGVDVPSIIPGYSGGVGENCIPCSGLSGTSTTGSPVLQANSTLNTNVIMGNAGYYPSGQGGGDGGPGGGGGAGGGASTTNPGSDGALGTHGNSGGAVGQGAAGGGIIYIKAGSYSITGAGKVFYSNGGQGENGKPGLNGGNGGQGGNGGMGSCISGTANGGGGTGGSGFPGSGSGGGDAGNGGSAGYIWLISQSAPHGVNSSHVEVNGGAGGKGGPGGFSYSLQCMAGGAIDFTGCTLDISDCTTGIAPCGDEHICDCDQVYEYLAQATSSSVSGSVVYFDTPDPKVKISYNGYYPGLVARVERSCNSTSYTYYHCNVYNGGDCEAIFTSIGNNITYAGAFSMPGDVVFIPLDNEYQILDPTGDELMWYKSSWEYIIDLTNPAGPMKCYNGSCLEHVYQSTNYIINQGPTGADAEPAPNGTTTAGNGTSNFPNGTLNPGETGWKNGPNGLNDITFNDLGITMYPNPSSGKVTLEFNSVSTGTVKLAALDLTGKVVFSQETNAETGTNLISINLESLEPGYYLIQVVFDGKTSVLPLTLN